MGMLINCNTNATLEGAIGFEKVCIASERVEGIVIAAFIGLAISLLILWLNKDNGEGED